jgi:hypothetical protein
MIALEIQGFKPWTDENIMCMRRAKRYTNHAKIAHK